MITMLGSMAQSQSNSREEISRFFDGLELVQPGVVFLPFWRPDSLPNEAEPGSMLMLCGVARKP